MGAKQVSLSLAKWAIAIVTVPIAGNYIPCTVIPGLRNGNPSCSWANGINTSLSKVEYKGKIYRSGDAAPIREITVEEHGNGIFDYCDFCDYRKCKLDTAGNGVVDRFFSTPTGYVAEVKYNPPKNAKPEVCKKDTVYSVDLEAFLK
jgi:hypothetical protein